MTLRHCFPILSTHYAKKQNKMGWVVLQKWVYGGGSGGAMYLPYTKKIKNKMK